MQSGGHPKPSKSLYFLGGALISMAPECQNPKSKNNCVTRRGILGASLGVARALMGHAFGTFLRLPATLVALCACYSGNFRSNLDKFPIFFLFGGSLERSRAAFLSISSKFPRIFGTFLAKLPENWKHGQTAEYIGPAILF